MLEKIILISYGYNQIDQLTNVTQLYGSAASSGYEPLALNGGPVRMPMLARLNAKLNRSPGLFGGATALLLLGMVMAIIPAEKRRRFILELAVGLTERMTSSRGERTRLVRPGRRVRRQTPLRMPSLFLRFVSVLTMLAVLASEPGFYQLCTAQGQCVYTFCYVNSRLYPGTKM
ncbi:MAG TPA: hypothetical protein VGY56_11185 [Verrucomicrobiae bacterium]|nr:hypothetical protein [Verrucomicrobiae bacterium]